jgi:TRAP-type C4-dicarboxylate transport system permease small subunit
MGWKELNRQVEKIFNNIEEVLSAIVMFVMLMLTFVNVIARYFLSSSISFTEEITTSLFVLLCTLGAAIAVKHNAHLGLSLITDKLSKHWQRRFYLLASVLGVIFSFVLLYKGIFMAIHEYELKQISITLQWPEWIYGSFVPIGAFFLTVRFIQSFF